VLWWLLSVQTVYASGEWMGVDNSIAERQDEVYRYIETKKRTEHASFITHKNKRKRKRNAPPLSLSTYHSSHPSFPVSHSSHSGFILLIIFISNPTPPPPALLAALLPPPAAHLSDLPDGISGTSSRSYALESAEELWESFRRAGDTICWGTRWGGWN
jgi:hypothetical protein